MAGKRKSQSHVSTQQIVFSVITLLVIVSFILAALR